MKFCLFTIWITMPISVPASARSQMPDSVVEWVRQCSDARYLTCEWTSTQEISDREGNIATTFDQTETFEYRWPTTFNHRTRVLPFDDHEYLAISGRFDKIVSVDESGHLTEQLVRRTGDRSLGYGWSLARMIQSQSPHAPALLGVWLGERGEHSVEIELNTPTLTIMKLDEINARVAIKPLKLRHDGVRPWVVERLELLSDSGQALMWWEYDQFEPVEDSPLYTGRSRISYAARRDGSIYEAPPAELTSVRYLSPVVQHAHQPLDEAVPDSTKSVPGGKDRVPQKPFAWRSFPALSILVGIAVTAGVAALFFSWRSRRT